jgi:hypothetical protein
MQILDTAKRRAAESLCRGISPRRLALTLVLGFVVGCIPLVGVPTALCALLALVFKLNQPAIQAANYFAMPFQVGLMVPLIKLGGKLYPFGSPRSPDVSLFAHSPAQWLSLSPRLAMQIGGMAGQALFAWLLLAIPLVLVLTPALTLLLRRVPRLAAANLGN